MQPASVLVLACGALAHEVMALLRVNDWPHLTLDCLPAKLHNTPAKIPEAVREKLRAAKGLYSRVFVAYGDCGTGGLLDDVLAEEGAERIEGAHCYEFFMGGPDFAAFVEDDPCVFFLTDFLARHFDKLVYRGLGLDRHPQLRDMYFGNYTRLVYLAQTEDPARLEMARAAAAKLGLAFEHRFTGYGGLERALKATAENAAGGPAPHQGETTPAELASA